MKTKILILLVLTLLLCNTISAIQLFEDKKPADVPADAKIELGEEVEVAPEKAAVTKPTNIGLERLHKKEAFVGDTVEIVFRITNKDTTGAVTVDLTETHRPGLTYLNIGKEVKYLTYEALEVPYYEWVLSIPAGSTRSVSYKVKATNVGMTMFSPAILIDEFGNKFEVQSTTIKFVCKTNGVCDKGENYIYCPDDCTTGEADSICDGVEDGTCDPDCEKEADPDCDGEGGRDEQQTRDEMLSSFPAEYYYIAIIILLVIVIAVALRRR